MSGKGKYEYDVIVTVTFEPVSDAAIALQEGHPVVTYSGPVKLIERTRLDGVSEEVKLIFTSELLRMKVDYER